MVEIAGIDAEQIVTSLMQIEERPLLLLQSRQEQARVAVDAIGRVRSDVDAFRLSAARLADVGSFDRFATTVSSPDAVTASVTGDASLGTISFTVGQLARAHGLRSIGTVASSSVPVTSESVIAVAGGTTPLGIGTVRAGAGLGEGAVAVEVVQSSTAATTAGTTALAASTVVDGSNDTLQITVNGAARTVTLAHGTYDPDGLVAAAQSALDASGGGVTADLDGSGSLELTTVREGSAASLQVTGGNALGALGLAVQATAAVGGDGVFEVDGTQTTVTNAEAGQSVAIDTGTGTLDVVLSGGVRVGSDTVEVVSTGDRSLASVAAAINDASAGVSAAAVRVADGEWLLQLNATATGTDGAIAIDGSVLDGLGGLVETSAAQNARITIGEGVGAYDIESSGNTFHDVLPGVALTVRSATTSPVTVDVGRNDDAIADDVSALVSAANDLLAEIKVQTRYDVETGAAGALVGNSTVRRLADDIRRTLSGAVDGVDGILASTVGIQSTRDGSFTFDRATFLSAVGDDPALVERLFGRGGTDTGDAVFSGATADTRAGSYDVEVTTAATRAESAMLFDGGAAAATRVGVRVGTVTATYDVSAGQTAAQIIDGLNGAIAEAGLDLVVDADGGGLAVRAGKWGSAGDFELNTDVLGAGPWDPLAGTDVEGTIDGVAAAGVGRVLTVSPLEAEPSAGLSVEVAGGALGLLGTVDYQPGLAARTVELTTAVTDDEGGTLTSAADFAQQRVDDFNDQIERYEDRLIVRETNLRRQWANLQTLLGGLQSQSDWITGQLATLNNNWGPQS